jgi:hypothetical protein
MGDQEIFNKVIYKMKFEKDFEVLEKHDKENETKFNTFEGWVNYKAQFEDCFYRMG